MRNSGCTARDSNVSHGSRAPLFDGPSRNHLADMSRIMLGLPYAALINTPTTINLRMHTQLCGLKQTHLWMYRLFPNIREWCRRVNVVSDELNQQVTDRAREKESEGMWCRLGTTHMAQVNYGFTLALKLSSWLACKRISQLVLVDAACKSWADHHPYWNGLRCSCMSPFHGNFINQAYSAYFDCGKISTTGGRTLRNNIE